MIVNIPIQIDESAFEGKVSKEIQDRVVKELLKQIKKQIASNASGYYYPDDERKFEAGLSNIVREKVADFINKYEEQIIEVAGKELATRLARTKKGKEIVERFDV